MRDHKRCISAAVAVKIVFAQSIFIEDPAFGHQLRSRVSGRGDAQWRPLNFLRNAGQRQDHHDHEIEKPTRARESNHWTLGTKSKPRAETTQGLSSNLFLKQQLKDSPSCLAGCL